MLHDTALYKFTIDIDIDITQVSCQNEHVVVKNKKLTDEQKQPQCDVDDESD